MRGFYVVVYTPFVRWGEIDTMRPFSLTGTRLYCEVTKTYESCRFCSVQFTVGWKCRPDVVGHLQNPIPLV